ncbi:penicillin-binding protein 2 [Patescibacteria group bacterium]|nr:penicillin-binding protein 2 [Patescibacteria group bacterium]
MNARYKKIGFGKKNGLAKNIDGNNRVNSVIAIIFLLGGAILFKLYSLQVMNYDLYLALASGQHQIFSELEPERGKIFIKDSPGGDSVYPIATNKEIALLYAVPKELKNPSEIADKLYAVFNQAGIEKEVDELLEELPENEKLDKDFLLIKRGAEINLRKESIINDYLKILSKNDDPYEPIKQRVDEDTLKKLYAVLASDENAAIKPEDLEIKNDKIYNNSAGEEKELKISGIAFVMESQRFYPEGRVGSHMLGFVGYAGDEKRGLYGLEGFFDNELYGEMGSIRGERAAGGDMIIINDRQYNKPRNGSDLLLTVNRTIQFTACKKLNEAVLKHGADGGSVIIMNPKTGAILAMCSYPDYDPNNYEKEESAAVYNNPAIFAQYEPGSIFKVMTMAMGLDQGKVAPDTVFNDTGSVKIANYNIENSDHKAYGNVTMNQVLEKSLNTGAIFVAKQVGNDKFNQYIKNFGFGEKTGIELEGESAGDIKNLTEEKINKDLYAATASFGQGIAVTPLQMAAAFGAIANGGVLMKPYLVKEIISADGVKIKTEPKQIRRVISERAAMLLGGMMVNVVENGHGKNAGVKGYYVGGKTGTAQIPKKDGRGYEENAHIGSFAGFAPVDDPVFVMITRIDNPRDVEWAESSAAPLFGELAEFILNYYQVPKER